MSAKRKRIAACDGGIGKRSCAASPSGLSVYVAVSSASPGAGAEIFQVAEGAIIDDLKPLARQRFKILFGDTVSDVDLVIECNGVECPEDEPIASYTLCNSVDSPLRIRLLQDSEQELAHSSASGAPATLGSKLQKSAAKMTAARPAECSVVYMELTAGTSDKFYELKPEGSTVTIRYGRRGTSGMITEKPFESVSEAKKFVDKTVREKTGKGYHAVAPDDAQGSSSGNADAPPDESEDPRADLEAGKKIFVQGSGKMPYTLRKFNGGYSCSCPGFTMNIKRNGIQATSCKHLKLIRGEEAEALRCLEFAGSGAGVGSRLSGGAASSKNGSVVSRISLAHAWKVSIDPENYVMSEKLDGMRAYWSAGKLWTRSGGEIAAPEWFISGLPLEVELDGELFLGRQKFDECMSIARRSDASDEWSRLKYVIFDAPKADGGVMARLATIENLIGDSTPFACIHTQQICRGIDHMLEELARVEQLGGEGLMIRHPSAGHRGGRTNDLLKVKSFHDDEAIVTAHEEGKGKYVNMVGSLVCKLKNGSMFKVGSGLSDSQRSYQTAPKVGTVITFKYFELTKDGIPRFPTFLRVRPDVAASDFATSTT